MQNFFEQKTLPSHFEGERYFSINTYLKSVFKEKTIKLPIDGGFTCPNRDGSKGFGGCKFCSENGSGEFASKADDETNNYSKAIDEQIELFKDKWPNAKYLAYFQNHTNTYAPVNELKLKYYSALNNQKISGLVIGTRPDCLSNDVLDLLEEINKDHFMWVELGLQTTKPDSMAKLNLCYNLNDFERATKELEKRNIKFVVHLILGLPDETKDDMLDSVRYVSKIKGLFGIKLHLFNVVKGSTLEKELPYYSSFDSIEEYVDLVVDALEIIPQNITIHRLTGDAPRSILISPVWSFNKRTILNSINDKLHLKDSWQGKYYEYLR